MKALFVLQPPRCSASLCRCRCLLFKLAPNLFAVLFVPRLSILFLHSLVAAAGSVAQRAAIEFACGDLRATFSVLLFRRQAFGVASPGSCELYANQASKQEIHQIDGLIAYEPVLDEF